LEFNVPFQHNTAISETTKTLEKSI